VNDLISVILPATDVDYDAWVRKYPQGFVVNIPGIKSDAMVWHRADCGHIRPDGRTRFVEGDQNKACCPHPGILATWAVAQGRNLAYCNDCVTKWLQEQ
jgi:hypothetical protein